MIVMKKQTTTIMAVDYIVCDNCNKKILEEDWVEWNEKLCIKFFGGYGSVFGDGAVMETQLCQECVKKMLGSVLRDTSEVY